MLFNSWTYLIFLTLSAIILFTLKKLNWRVYFIGIASIVFYSFWRWEYVSIMILSAFVDYLCSLKIQNIRDGRSKGNPLFYLVLTLVINLGLLVAFKYTYFLYDNFTSFLNIFGIFKLPHW